MAAPLLQALTRISSHGRGWGTGDIENRFHFQVKRERGSLAQESSTDRAWALS
jgi:hypothetical protein